MPFNTVNFVENLACDFDTSWYRTHMAHSSWLHRIIEQSLWASCDTEIRED